MVLDDDLAACPIRCTAVSGLESDHWDERNDGRCFWLLGHLVVYSLGGSMASPSHDPAPAPASEVDEEDFTSLEEGTLAVKWEAQQSLRRRVSQGLYLTQWPKGAKGQSTDGIPSVAAMALNPLVLEAIAEWWCPANDAPKAVPVDLLRREARSQNKQWANLLDVKSLTKRWNNT